MSRNYESPAGPRYAGGPPAGHADTVSDPATLRIVSLNIEFGAQVDSAIGLLRSDPALRAAFPAARYSHVIIGGDMNAAAVGRVARDLGRWDHSFLRGLASPDSAAARAVLDAGRAKDHRPVWAVALLR